MGSVLVHRAVAARRLNGTKFAPARASLPWDGAHQPVPSSADLRTDQQPAPRPDGHVYKQQEDKMKFQIKCIVQWLLPVALSSWVHASDARYELLECPSQKEAANTQSCLQQCTSIGSNPTSYEVDLVGGVVTETTWQASAMLAQRRLPGCTIKDAQNWRCQSESVMMGGIVRRDTYAVDGQVLMEVGGSGGEQFYCSVPQQ